MIRQTPQMFLSLLEAQRPGQCFMSLAIAFFMVLVRPMAKSAACCSAFSLSAAFCAPLVAVAAAARDMVGVCAIRPWLPSREVLGRVIRRLPDAPQWECRETFVPLPICDHHVARSIHPRGMGPRSLTEGQFGLVTHDHALKGR